MTPVPKQPPRIESEKHRKFVAQHWCVVCRGAVVWEGYTVSQCCHVRIGFNCAGRRPCDSKTVPMCPEHHQSGPDAQHDSNEAEWWERQGIDPFDIAYLLAISSPDAKIREAANVKD